MDDDLQLNKTSIGLHVLSIPTNNCFGCSYQRYSTLFEPFNQKPHDRDVYNMAGILNGVAKKIRAEEPRHCSYTCCGPSLNPVVRKL